MTTQPTYAFAGAEWVRAAFNVEMSPLGMAVANLLGDVWLGIYHLDRPALFRVAWDDPYVITFNLRYRALSTWDGDELTRLVILCHERCIRLDLKAVAPNCLRLIFHQRKRDGGMYERHPTIEQAIERVRGHYGGWE